MELSHYLRVLRKRWMSVVTVTLVILAAVVAGTLAVTPKYTATTRMFFAVQGSESATDLAQGSTFAEKQMASYAQVATSPLVLDRVIKKLKLPMTAEVLAESVVATPPADTVILEISVTDPDRVRSAQIANGIGEQLTIVAGDLAPARSDGSKSVKATRLAAAKVPLSASSPRIVSNLVGGVILGLLVGVCVALIRQAMDTKIRTERDLQEITDATLLGAVGFDEAIASSPVVMRNERLAHQAEAVRRVRTNLQFVNLAQRHSTILVSSSIPGEGKSTTALNLAVALADAGVRTILVDADLRRPSIATYLGLEGSVGLTTVLIGRATVSDVVQPWESGTLHILPAGEIPPNPSEILGSDAMKDLLDELSNTYDMVLLDTPPLLPVTDAAVLSKFASGTLVIVGTDRIQGPQLRNALQSLETVGGRVIGVVLNKTARRDVNAYSYGYDYSYERTVSVPHEAPWESEQEFSEDIEERESAATGRVA